MQFGNWEVREEGIAWNVKGLNRFVIARDGLNAIRKEGEEEIFYDWILLATEEDWLTQNDLYDLNYAFVYAIARYGMDFNYEIFDATLAEQYDQFEEEDELDPE